jgi:hypothetical protein
MKRNKSAAFLLMVLACCAVAAGSAPGLPAPEKSKALHQVKKIHIAQTSFNVVKTEDADGRQLLKEEQARQQLEQAEARDKRMGSLLETELKRVGFEVVKDKKDAEAVLVGMIVPLGGNQPGSSGPRRYIYKLMPQTYENFHDFFTGKGKLWEANVKMSDSRIEDESDRSAAVRIAENLLKAWLKSAQKAGLSTGDKVQ